MRKYSTVALLLLLSILCAAMPVAQAESMERETIVIDYEGAWAVFEDLGIRLYLPADWIGIPSEDVYFAATNGTGTQHMWIEAYGADGLTMDSLLADMASIEEFQLVRGIYYNGVAFVTYVDPEADLLGYITLSRAGDLLFFFKFSPVSDPGLPYLTTQIMASLSAIAQ